MSIFGFRKKNDDDEDDIFTRKPAVSRSLIDSSLNDSKKVDLNVPSEQSTSTSSENKIDTDTNSEQDILSSGNQEGTQETQKANVYESNPKKLDHSLPNRLDAKINSSNNFPKHNGISKFVSNNAEEEVDNILRSLGISEEDIALTKNPKYAASQLNLGQPKNITENPSNNDPQIDAIIKELGLSPDIPKLPDSNGSTKKSFDLPPQPLNLDQSLIANASSDKIAANTNGETSKQKQVFSTIMSLAISRPVEVAYDLTDRYEKEEYERLDLHANNQDLIDYISDKPHAKYLDMSDCQLITDYSLIGQLVDLEELDLSGIPNLSDISFLNDLKKLRVLNLGATAIDTLENFPSLPNLEVLNLKMNKIKYLDGIESCPNLHELVLWGCTSLDNIDILKNFTELRSLDLDSCNVLRDINAVANMEKLVYLNLNFTRIEDLTPIKGLINLEVFTMDFCPIALSEQSLANFDNLVKLKFLGLRNRVIRNLSHFKNMTEMAELELSGNAINDLSPLENMTKLQILNLSTNPSLVDLSPLYRMKKLKKLIISGAKSGKTITVAMLIEDISVVKELESLEVFESNFNKKLKDISPLQYCQKLEEVDLNDCFAISDVTPLRFCKNLKEIYLENCTQIKDLTFVKYLKNLEKITLAKTSAERILISDWTTLLDLRELKDGDGTLPIHKAVINSIKFRKKISKIAKKTIKEDED